MILPTHNIQYFPGPLPKDSISVYPSEEDRKWSNGTHYSANCELIRKDVAIARNQDNLFLVRIVQMGSYEARCIAVKYYGIIIFQQDIRDIIRSESHIYHLDRTIKGYYIFTHTYYKSKCIPGKDDEYEVTDTIVFDENGNIVSDWKNKNIGYGQIPVEVAPGLLEYQNVFYELDSLKEVFRIPSKYTINGCFIDGLLHLNVPDDNRVLYTTVKNAQIIDQYLEEDLDSKIDELSILERQYLEKKYSFDFLLPINKSKSEEWIQHIADKVINSIDLRGRYCYEEDGYILPNEIATDFDDNCNKTIPDKVNRIINQIRLYLIKNRINNFCNSKINYNPFFKLTSKNSCYINNKITFIYRDNVENYERDQVYSLFDIYGQKLSEHSFAYILSPYSQYSNRTSINYTDNDNCIYEAKIYGTERKVVLGYLDGNFFETKLPQDCGLYKTANGIFYIMNKKKGSFFDVFMNPIKIEYIECNVKPEIDKYLYNVEPNFYPDNQELYCGSRLYGYGPEIILSYHKPNVGYYKGKFCLPYPYSFKFSIEEMEARNKNKPNFVNLITKIMTFYLEDGPVSIYRFQCEPWAYCDLSGKIYYNFDADNITL